MANLDIKIQKATACPSCKEYIYKLPIGMDIELATSLEVFGQLMFPLDKFKVVMIKTDSITLDSGIGRSDIRVKFLKETISMSALLKSTLSKWLHGQGHEVAFIG